MDVLAECVKAMKKEDIKTYHSNLFTLFLEALDFRTHHNQGVGSLAIRCYRFLEIRFLYFLRCLIFT